MKKILVLGLILISCLTFGQKKKVAHEPKFKISYDKFEKEYNYRAIVGSLELSAFSSTNDFSGLGSKFLCVNVRDSYLTHAEGLILLFSDNTTMELETTRELGDRAGNGMWDYYLIASNITNEQWNELSTKKIVSYKAHIFSRTYKHGNSFKKLASRFAS